jgi:hypothetical protein
MTATVGTRFQASKQNASNDDHCRAVRTAFAETIQPHSTVDVDESEPVLATIEAEFTDSIAIALAPTTDKSFTDDLKQAITAEADARRTETAVMRRALDREETLLEDAATTVEEITAWIATADETPLTDLDFERLHDRHATLAIHRRQCEDLAVERQDFLRATTSRNVEARLRHRSLAHYLYQEFLMDHPVLTTVARLDATCAACQCAIREHLVRRV